MKPLCKRKCKQLRVLSCQIYDVENVYSYVMSKKWWWRHCNTGTTAWIPGPGKNFKLYFILSFRRCTMSSSPFSTGFWTLKRSRKGVAASPAGKVMPLCVPILLSSNNNTLLLLLSVNLQHCSCLHSEVQSGKLNCIIPLVYLHPHQASALNFHGPIFFAQYEQNSLMAIKYQAMTLCCFRTLWELHRYWQQRRCESLSHGKSLLSSDTLSITFPFFFSNFLWKASLQYCG